MANAPFGHIPVTLTEVFGSRMMLPLRYLLKRLIKRKLKLKP
jgi:hypothetical protein